MKVGGSSTPAGRKGPALAWARRGFVGRIAAAIGGILFGPTVVEARSDVVAGAPLIRFLGDWGDGDAELAARICTLAMDEALRHLTPGEIAGLPRLIEIVQDRRGPFAALAEPGLPVVTLHLNTRDRRWAQYVFQFGHELGHVMANYRRVDFRTNPHQWLEEACCGALTIFCMDRMGRRAMADPASPVHGLAAELIQYAEDRRRDYERDGVVVAPQRWLAAHAAELSAARGLVAPATAFVTWLERHFQEQPKLIPSLRYLNQWSPTEVGSLGSHLQRWRERAPAGRNGLPLLLIRELGVTG